jgi:hypothetical protein
MINQEPLIISFYTNDWKYPDHATRMAEDCKRLGLDHHIKEKPSTKDYIQNTAIKPFFVKECLETFKRPVLWIDVDGLLLQKPNLTNLSTDFAAPEYFNKKELDRDWAVSILWFNFTAGSIKLVNSWCEHSKNKTDEAGFDLAWKSLKNEITSYQLPQKYHYVKWRSSLEIPKDTIFCNRLSTFEDKMRRKNKNDQVKESYD